MMMPLILVQRLTVALPLIGVGFLLASIVLPVRFGALSWGLAMITFLAALACALLAQRGQRLEDRSPRH